MLLKLSKKAEMLGKTLRNKKPDPEIKTKPD